VKEMWHYRPFFDTQNYCRIHLQGSYPLKIIKFDDFSGPFKIFHDLNLAFPFIKEEQQQKKKNRALDPFCDPQIFYYCFFI